MTKPAPETAKTAFDWAQFALRLVGIVERWLPAILVALIDRLRDDRRQLAAKVAANEHTQGVAHAEACIAKAHAWETPEQTVEKFLGGRLGSERANIGVGRDCTSCAQPGSGTSPGQPNK
jgi:hypothetical protein